MPSPDVDDGESAGPLVDDPPSPAMRPITINATSSPPPMNHGVREVAGAFVAVIRQPARATARVGQLSEPLVVGSVGVDPAVPDGLEQLGQLDERARPCRASIHELAPILAGRAAREVFEHTVVDQRPHQLAVASAHGLTPLAGGLEALGVAAPVGRVPSLFELDRELLLVGGFRKPSATKQ